MLATDSGSPADVTANVARRRERTAVVALRFEDDDVDFGQEQQHQRDRRRRTDGETVNHRSTLHSISGQFLPT